MALFLLIVMVNVVVMILIVFPTAYGQTEFGISRADSVFTDIRMEQINNATPGTAANSAIFNKTSTHGFMNAFLPDNLPTSYYFDLNKALAISEWENLFGAISAGPIDINDQVEETLDADITRNGNALNTEIVEVSTDEGEIFPYGGVRIVVRVLYQFVRGTA